MPVAQKSTMRSGQASRRRSHSRCASIASRPTPYTPSADRWQKNSIMANTADRPSRRTKCRSRKATQQASAHSAMPMPKM